MPLSPVPRTGDTAHSVTRGSFLSHACAHRHSRGGQGQGRATASLNAVLVPCTSLIALQYCLAQSFQQPREVRSTLIFQKRKPPSHVTRERRGLEVGFKPAVSASHAFSLPTTQPLSTVPSRAWHLAHTSECLSKEGASRGQTLPTAILTGDTLVPSATVAAEDGRGWLWLDENPDRIV